MARAATWAKYAVVDHVLLTIHATLLTRSITRSFIGLLRPVFETYSLANHVVSANLLNEIHGGKNTLVQLYIIRSLHMVIVLLLLLILPQIIVITNGSPDVCIRMRIDPSKLVLTNSYERTTKRKRNMLQKHKTESGSPRN